MKFVYFGYDFMLGGAARLLREGHTLLGVFSFPCDGIFNFNAGILDLAQRLNVPATLEKPKPEDIEYYLSIGCECFLSAGYPFKIPPIGPGAYGVNLHPSLLPQGRGLMPTPHIIINHPQASGLTAHKLTPQFDEGDILYQIKLPIGPRETVESLSARIALHAPGMLSMLFSDMPSYWNGAREQNPRKASYFPPPTEEMRRLDWRLGAAQIDRVARAFGRYGSIAEFDGALWVVYALDAWEEKHGFNPGDVVCRLSREIVIAAKDGFVCLKEFHAAKF